MHGLGVSCSAWDDELPQSVQRALWERGVGQMQPVQASAWKVVKEGYDAVVSSPTATGKTLAYVVPLAARLAKAKKKIHTLEASKRSVPAPGVIVLAPSRELTLQIGKEFDFVANAFAEENLVTAIACGGMPMERTVASLRKRGGADIIVATPGRLAELLRSKQVSLRKLETLVLDEADALLDEDDVPEVRRFLDEMEADYQLLLFSATITKKVRTFAHGLMELDHSGSEVDLVHSRRTKFDHFVLAAAESEWPVVAADILLTRLHTASRAIVFVRTIAMAELLSDYFIRALRHSRVLALHGDLGPAARKRAIYHLSEQSQQHAAVLVATDVAARGLDVPGVDLVIQLGLPRKRGLDGTLDTDLYAHRSGRAGREANSTSTSIVFFDPTNGEHRLLSELSSFLNQDTMRLIAPPSSTDLAQAAVVLASHLAARVPTETLLAFPETKSHDISASAAALIAGLDCLPIGTNNEISRLKPRSLLTAKTTDRTLCLRPGKSEPSHQLSASLVTRIFKALGSGKVPSVKLIHNTAYIDFPAHKANAIRDNALRNPDLIPAPFQLLLLPDDDPAHVFPWIDFSASFSSSSSSSSLPAVDQTSRKKENARKKQQGENHNKSRRSSSFASGSRRKR